MLWQEESWNFRLSRFFSLQTCSQSNLVSSSLPVPGPDPKVWKCRPNGERVVLGPTLDADNEIKHCSLSLYMEALQGQRGRMVGERKWFPSVLESDAQNICVNVRFFYVDCNKSVEGFWSCELLLGAVQPKVTSEIKWFYPGFFT